MCLFLSINSQLLRKKSSETFFYYGTGEGYTAPISDRKTILVGEDGCMKYWKF